MRSSWRGTSLAVSAAVLGFGLSAARSAAAQNEGFALDRFEPSERGSQWFTADTLDLRGSNRWAIGAVGDWAYKPLVAYDTDGDEQTVVIAHQIFGHFGLSVVLAERLRLGLNLPVLLYTEGRPENVEGLTYRTDEGAALGDLRLAADLRLVGEYGGPATLALGMAVHAPTGDRAAYAGDGSTRLRPRLQVAGKVSLFVYSARAGVAVRTQQDNFAREPFGNEVEVAAAAGIQVLDDRLVAGPELFATTALNDDGAFDRQTTPAEILFGAHYDVASHWRLGAGVGPGLSRGFGSPAVRCVASLEWFQPYREKEQPQPADSDGDGILDPDDACPKEPGERTDDPATNGCPPPPPPPADTDGDGIPDDKDACPKEPGVENTEDPRLHGCPPPDADGDGVIDAEDACPQEAGVKNPEDPAKHGCPLPKDADGDGILDADDACPDQPGEANADPKRNGCPKVVVEKGELRILERIEFETAKAVIRPESDGILSAVLKVLQDHSEIQQIEVQGHTDNRGGAAYNRGLSQRRAEAVVKWLVQRGIDPGRLVPKGYGPGQPIDSNDTDVGRQNNRRVQFIILKSEGESNVQTK